MAILEITELTVRAQATDKAFELGRELAEQVGSVDEDGMRVCASVAGVDAELRFSPAGIQANCAACGNELCAHGVAVALSWLRLGVDYAEPDLFTVLREMDADWLAARLTEAAAGDPELRERLLLAAGGHMTGADLRTLRDDLEAALEDMTDGVDRDDYYNEWYPDTGDVEEIIDDIEEHLEHEPDAVRTLARNAIDLLEAVLDDYHCHGEDITDTLARVEELYLNACQAGSPDPLALAEELFAVGLHSGWGTFDDVAPYAEILGPAGIAHYAARLQQQESGGPLDHRLRSLAESLARFQGEGGHRR